MNGIATNCYYLNTATLGIGEVTPDGAGTTMIASSNQVSASALGSEWNQTQNKSNGYPKLSWE